MTYRRTGKSGLMLPLVSLGLWHNFGERDDIGTAQSLICRAFDAGITHFDLANNYGPPPGSAETTFGRILKTELAAYRDEIIVSTKAGYGMWPGPYGDWGSKKYLTASLDASLKRMGLDYVDIFYSHRPDPETPLAETVEALSQAVRQGKAIYVGVSNYNPAQTAEAAALLENRGLHCLIHQMKYSMLVRTPESGLFDALERNGIGGIAFSPLAQGLLSNRYLEGIPRDSRAGKPDSFLPSSSITPELIDKLRGLEKLSAARGQTLAQMALAWVIRHPVVTSCVIGASRIAQLEDNLGAINNIRFSDDELSAIDRILAG
jgi:L-glyceraldehyde 3-phosphate reductase